MRDHFSSLTLGVEVGMCPRSTWLCEATFPREREKEDGCGQAAF